jgi:hypothetical protein
VAQQRLYQLVRQRGLIADRTFEIVFEAPGVETYVFTFGSRAPTRRRAGIDPPSLGLKSGENRCGFMQLGNVPHSSEDSLGWQLGAESVTRAGDRIDADALHRASRDSGMT